MRQKRLTFGSEQPRLRNTGRVPLRTLNSYVPPAYERGDDELPRGRK